MNTCPFDPTIYAKLPIGMFHCEICGEMVIAGIPHPDYSILDDLTDEDVRAITGEPAESDNTLTPN